MSINSFPIVLCGMIGGSGGIIMKLLFLRNFRKRIRYNALVYL